MAVVKFKQPVKKVKTNASLRGKPGINGEDGAVGAIGPVGPKGDRGEKGERGEQGIQGERGKQGIPGIPGSTGLNGQAGEQGAVPEHRWKGESIQFQNPDGTWGKLVNVQGSQGRGFVGGGTLEAPVKYTSVTAATYTVLARDLLVGHNIYGVNYAGAVTITVPANIPSTHLIVINDESGSADSNNITIVTA